MAIAALAVVAFAGATAAETPARTAETPALTPETPARGWPRTIQLEQGTLVVYSPQLEKLEGVTLSGRAAVSWQKKGGEPVFGVFWFDARVLVDKERRLVSVEELTVTKVRFPNATPEQEKRVASEIETQVPEWDLSPSLDEVQAAIAASQRARRSEQGITANPPKLVFAEEPAVLLLYDGEPAVRPIADAGLERVVNTPLLVVRDPETKRFYLGSGTFWYEAAEPKGPWKPTAEPTAKVKAFFEKNRPPPQAEGAEAAPGQPPSPPGQPPDTPPSQQPAAAPGEPVITAPGQPPPAPPGQQPQPAVPAQPQPAPPGQPQPAVPAQPQPAPPGQPQPAVPAQPQPAPPGQPSPAAPAQPQPATKKPASPQPERPPKIVVATKPTELIAFDGKPSWAPLATDAKLLYADNTDGTVVVHVPTNETFVLVSGRWYKAKSLQGPWTAVRPDKLPAAFKSIPPDSGLGSARTFVTGTEEAEDALADAQIPQTTAVKRDQTIQVTYDGEPKFKAIEGTSIEYAVNTPFSVLKDSGLYWCCHQAVWYVASSPKGPWKVSERRPPSVDRIPPSSPVYNVRYVDVYTTTPTVAYVGYLPGYVGVYPYYGSVVYGTGFYYPPYIGAVACYPYPATFGVHVGFNPWTGFGVGVSWGTPFVSVGVSFGGYGRFYGPVGYRAPYRPAYGYRPPPAGYRGGYGGYRAPPPGYRGGYPAGSAGTRGTGAAPPRTTASGNLYNQPGNAQRNVASAQGASTRAPSASSAPNNVYGDKSGNVYRQNPGGSWDKNTASGWQQAGAGAQPRSPSGAGSAPSAPSAAPAGLSSDATARTRSSAGAYGGAAAGRGGGGGGARGGGGRR